MYLAPQTSRDQILERLRKLATSGAALYRRAEINDPPMTERDLAMAIELNQQYVDILTELEDLDFISESFAVEVML